jgi:hypothetical protein
METRSQENGRKIKFRIKEYILGLMGGIIGDISNSTRKMEKA